MIVLFFDTETTGIPSDTFKPEIVQLAAILCDMDNGRTLAEINVIVDNPESEVPKIVSDIHGITTDIMHKFGVGVSTADELFATLLSQADRLVAHNIEFDIQLLKDNLRMSRAVLENHTANGRLDTYCTMLNARDILKLPFTSKQEYYYRVNNIMPDLPYRGPRLIEAFRHFHKKDFADAHNAMADVKACRAVYSSIQAFNQQKEA